MLIIILTSQPHREVVKTRRSNDILTLVQYRERNKWAELLQYHTVRKASICSSCYTVGSIRRGTQARSTRWAIKCRRDVLCARRSRSEFPEITPGLLTWFLISSLYNFQMLELLSFTLKPNIFLDNSIQIIFVTW